MKYKDQEGQFKALGCGRQREPRRTRGKEEYQPWRRKEFVQPQEETEQEQSWQIAAAALAPPSRLTTSKETRHLDAGGTARSRDEA